MRVILELNTEEAVVPAETLSEIAGRAIRAIRGNGIRVHPRLLVELEPNYLELPIPDRGNPEKA